MNLGSFPRRRFTRGPTPLEPLDRLSDHLGGPRIWVKRDDLTGLAGGGNKARKLEFLVADALARGCDTLITCGAVQSNHCRLTAAAAVREGLACRLVLEEKVAGTYDPDAGGNNLLYRLLGVEDLRVEPAGADLTDAMQQVADELRAEGRKGYIIPTGGSNPLGALGYVACAQELLFQAFEHGLRLDHVVVTSGSGGTHAGLLVGLEAMAARVPLTGISVIVDAASQTRWVGRLAEDTADLLGVPAPSASTVRVDDRWLGPGYSLPSDAMTAAVQLVARLEGLLLDPVYTGKAMAGLIGLVQAGALDGDNVVFVHTGGAPSLFHYKDQVLPHSTR